ncbi:reverse transcriptase domain-containing protein [Tanacetum coccineum]
MNFEPLSLADSFPPALFDRLLREIRAFSRLEIESLSMPGSNEGNDPKTAQWSPICQGQYYHKFFYHGLREITLRSLRNAAAVELISNKHKIEQISAAFLSDESSAMIQNKVPPKLGDPESFLIPCNFNKTFSCNALADLAENMLVEVGKFTFPADFVILEMEEDSKVPLILGRPFLHTADAVIRVKQKQLNLGVGTE